MAIVIVNQPASGQLTQSPVLFKVSDVANSATIINCKLTIWMGEKPFVSGGFVYNLSKTITNSGEFVIFDVSQFVKDTMNPTNLTGGFDPLLFNIVGPETAWIECEFNSNGSIPSTSTSLTIGCTAGFRLYSESVNLPSPTVRRSTSILYTGKSNKVYLNVGQNIDAIKQATITFDIGGTLVITNTRLDLNFAYTLAMYLDVSPSNAGIVGLFDKFYTVTIQDLGDLDVGIPVKIVVECEPKYDPYTVAFVNRYGVFETIAFNKANTQDFIATSSEFQKDNFNEAAFSYPTNKPQIQKFNTQGQNRITLNTSFIDQSSEVTMKELMMSEEAIILETGQPINTNTMTLESKQSVNKQMIQYTLGFDYANKYQSTVR